MSSLSFTTTACQGWSNPNVNYSNPTITYLSGTYSPAGATTLVAIFGTNFKLFSTIKFGTFTPTMIFISSQQIDFYVPTTATFGTYPVQVFNDTYASNIVNYTIDDAPGFWRISSTNTEAIENTNPNGLLVNGPIQINNIQDINIATPTPVAGNIVFNNNIIGSGNDQFIKWNNTDCSITASSFTMYITYNLNVQGSIHANGDITAIGTVSASNYITTSDYRIKDNIVSLHDSDLYSVDNLKPVKYFNKKSGKEDIGFIAHEVQEIFPCLVTGEKDGEELQSLNYMGLIGVLTKEIQILKAEVAELKKAQTKS